MRTILAGARRFGGFAARIVPVALRDLAGLAGVGLVAYGAWRVHEAAGFIVGGVLLIAAAFLFESGRKPGG
jgi:hypothetical protein